MQISDITAVKLEKPVYVIVSFLLFIYLCLRAYFVPLVHDEAATFFVYIRLFNFIPGQAYWDAGNHILNSFLAGLSYKLFGSHPFFLRLPNVLAFLVFAFATYKIGKYINVAFCRWAFWATLLFSTFVIEFFALTRGYGLAMAFMLLSVFYFFRFQKHGNLKSLTVLLLSLGLMVLGNLSFFYAYLLISAWVGLLIFRNIFRKKTKTIFQLIVLIVLGIFPAYVAAQYGLELRERGLLYYGSLEGFWDLTVQHLHYYIFYNDFFLSKLLVVAIGATSILIAIFFAIKSYKISLYTPTFVFPALLLGCVVIILFQAEVMGVNYPSDRTSIYLYLLWVGTLFFILDKLLAIKQWKFIKFFACLALFFPISFIWHSNLAYSQLWNYEHISPKIYKLVNNKSNNLPPTVSGYFLRKTIWDFFNMRLGKMPTQSLTQVGYPFPYTHFILLRKPDYPTFQYHELYTQIYYDEYSGLRLFERNRAVKLKPIKQTTSRPSPPTNAMYFDLLAKDSLPIHGFAIDVEMQLKFNSLLFQGTITAQRWVADTVYVSANYGIGQSNAKLKNGTLKIKVRLYLTALKKWQPNRLVVFIYNKKKQQSYHVLNYTAKLYKLPLIN